MGLSLNRSTQILLAVTCVLLVGDLAVVALVGTGAIDPARFTVQERERPVVVTSTTVIDDLVLRIAGDKVHRELLVGPGGDPHVYEPTSRDQVAITRADLIVLNGFGLEPKVERLIESVLRDDQRVVEAAAGLEPYFEDYNGHPAPDPHMWLSIPRAIRYVENIRDALAEVDPANAALYRANANVTTSEMRLLDAHIRQMLSAIPPENRKLVTTHDAFRYFGNEYGIEIVDTVWGVTTDTEPTGEDVARIVERIKQLKVPAVFLESSTNPELLRTIARDANVRIGGTLFSDSLGLPESRAHTFTGMMLRNAEILVAALGPDAGGSA